MSHQQTGSVATIEVPVELLKSVLARLESDWNLLDAEFGAGRGAYAGSIAAGHEPEAAGIMRLLGMQVPEKDKPVLGESYDGVNETVTLTLFNLHIEEHIQSNFVYVYLDGVCVAALSKLTIANPTQLEDDGTKIVINWGSGTPGDLRQLCMNCSAAGDAWIKVETPIA